MKIIISHDVDHLYGKEHWFRDLFYPKLWVRESLGMFKHEITFREWALRCKSCFLRKRNKIPELVAFDLNNGIPSTFFFGMAQGLSMSYKPSEAKRMMEYVRGKGFDIGVHGICYDQISGIEVEKQTFTDLMGFTPEGIRMHYVRFNENTFKFLDSVGYRFDSTEFDKNSGFTVKDAYKIGKLCEFPINIMDTYLPYDFTKAAELTLKCLELAESKGCKYFTVLLHDVNFADDFAQYKKWYEWFVDYINSNRYEKCFFRDAVSEMNCNE